MEATDLTGSTHIEVRSEYHALELGAGRAVVFLHDLFGSHASFAAVMELMAEDWRTVGLDLPGHGLSTPLPSEPDDTGAPPSDDLESVADDVHAVLAEFAALPAALVGEGVGATVALEVAAAHPGDVTAVVLVSPGLGAEVETLDDPDVAAWLDGTGSSKDFVDAVMPRRHCGGFFRDQPGQAGEERERLAQLDPSGVAPLAAAVRASGDRSSLMAELGVPVLVVSGDDDGIAGAGRMGRFADASGVTVEVITRCGHSVSVEQPERLARRIGEFLDGR